MSQLQSFRAQTKLILHTALTKQHNLLGIETTSTVKLLNPCYITA